LRSNTGAFDLLREQYTRTRKHVHILTARSQTRQRQRIYVCMHLNVYVHICIHDIYTHSQSGGKQGGGSRSLRNAHTWHVLTNTIPLHICNGIVHTHTHTHSNISTPRDCGGKQDSGSSSSADTYACTHTHIDVSIQ